MMGVKPTTFWMATRCSITELHSHVVPLLAPVTPLLYSVNLTMGPNGKTVSKTSMCSVSESNRLYSSLEGWRTTFYAYTAFSRMGRIRTYILPRPRRARRQFCHHSIKTTSGFTYRESVSPSNVSAGDLSQKDTNIAKFRTSLMKCCSSCRGFNFPLNPPVQCYSNELFYDNSNTILRIY